MTARADKTPESDRKSGRLNKPADPYKNVPPCPECGCHDLSDTVDELRAAKAENEKLRYWVEHKAGCNAYPRIGEFSMHEERCNCGLYTLLEQKP